MSNIRSAFKDKKAFIPFITAGFPNEKTTKDCIKEMVRAGADLIEIGIPFSDPTAEGPVIQGANEEALKNGMTTEKVFDMVSELRSEIKIPLVFMTYSNVIFSYGKEKFMKKCRDTGIDGIILPDLPYEEKDEFLSEADEYGIDLISLIAPTSYDRIKMIAKGAKGFLYIVSSLGVTGVRNEINTDLDSIVKAVRESTDIPCAIGFGIKDPIQAKKMAEISDGAIVGSAIINIIDKYRDDPCEHIYSYVKEMKDAVGR